MSSPTSGNNTKSKANMPPAKRAKTNFNTSEVRAEYASSLAKIPRENLQDFVLTMLMGGEMEEALPVLDNSQSKPLAASNNPERERAWRELSRWQGQRKVDLTKFFQETDILIHILSFLGPGHFLYLALVSKQFKYLYQVYFATVKNPPKVFIDRDSKRKIPAVATSTFYSAAFSSLSCAKFWYAIAKESNTRLGRLQEWFEDETIWDEVAVHGNPEVLKWASQKGFVNDDEYTCAAAARGGNLEGLKWLHKNGFAWDRKTCGYAAKGGYLECLKWARAHGCDWDYRTCTKAAYNGHLDLLKWAHRNGCPGNELSLE